MTSAIHDSKTFYRRKLPAHLIAFESAEGRQVFKEALIAGTMECYFAVASQFHTQSEPEFCGLGTLAMVLNALAVDPARVWKGVWRWFSEELLNCCTPLGVVKMKGLTIPEFACLARCNGAKAETRLAEVSDMETFREWVRRAAATPEGEVIVASYDRRGLKQTGSGHFSPIGGYHAGLDMCLLLDVARFKYPPHWVPLTDLFNAMKAHDPETGRSRGFLRLTSCGRVSIFCRVRADSSQWKDVIKVVSQRFPAALRAQPPAAVDDIVRTFLALAQTLPVSATGSKLFDAFVTFQAALNDHLSPEHVELLEQLFAELHATPMFGVVERLVSSGAVAASTPVGTSSGAGHDPSHPGTEIIPDAIATASAAAAQSAARFNARCAAPAIAVKA
eukprot:TRINITY_DN27659_c0_g1_i1.p1 TRINITY_DN27659_c0_g1~~TRINITY_DN27659_c0_g1_i1.p1  ORF type:complete len:390 (+),score=115.27 TRINITY_DN27659_c0_g1_i1:213-1382(+)